MLLKLTERQRQILLHLVEFGLEDYEGEDPTEGKDPEEYVRELNYLKGELE